MKKPIFIYFILLAFVIVLNSKAVMAGQFDKVQSGVVTSSGTTTITFNFKTTEIYYHKISTNSVYVNFCSSFVTTNDRILNNTSGEQGTVNAQSNKMTVNTNSLPFNFRWEAHGWKQ
jgi:hypothetical protein